MNYLLFQPASLLEPDKVYLNGRLVEDVSKRREVYDKIVLLFNSIGTKTYPWFGKAGGFFVLRGLFDVKDEKGRTLPFLFASDNENFQDELKSLSIKVGYNIDRSTLNIIDNPSNYLEKKRSIFKYIFLTILSIVLITIISLLCKSSPTF